MKVLMDKRKSLCDQLHNKKFKTRMQKNDRKIKKAEANKPIEDRQPVRIVYKEVPKEIIITKEVPVKVPFEVIIEKPVYVNQGGGIPDDLETDEFMALLKQIREVYLKNSPVKINTYIKTSDGVGYVKSLNIDESELMKKGGGIYAKAKRIRNSDGKEGQRYMGKDARGYKVTDVQVIPNIKEYLKEQKKSK